MYFCTAAGSNCDNYVDDDTPYLRCGHELNLCTEHIAKLIHTHVHNLAEPYVKCPVMNCATFMNDADIQKYIDPKDDDE